MGGDPAGSKQKQVIDRDRIALVKFVKDKGECPWGGHSPLFHPPRDGFRRFARNWPTDISTASRLFNKCCPRHLLFPFFFFFFVFYLKHLRVWSKALAVGMAPKATSPPPSFVVAQIHCEHKQPPLLTYIFDPTCDCCVDRGLLDRGENTKQRWIVRFVPRVVPDANWKAIRLKARLIRNAFNVVFKFSFFFLLHFSSNPEILLRSQFLLGNVYE